MRRTGGSESPLRRVPPGEQHKSEPLEAALPLRYRVLSATAGALITSIVTTPFDVVKTRQQAAKNAVAECTSGSPASAASASARSRAAVRAATGLPGSTPPVRTKTSASTPVEVGKVTKVGTHVGATPLGLRVTDAQPLRSALPRAVAPSRPTVPTTSSSNEFPLRRLSEAVRATAKSTVDSIRAVVRGSSGSARAALGAAALRGPSNASVAAAVGAVCRSCGSAASLCAYSTCSGAKASAAAHGVELSGSSRGGRRFASVAAADVAEYNAFRMAVHITRTDGFFALWSGLSPTLLMSVPSTTLYFGAYEVMRDAISDSTGAFAPLVAGTCARTLAVIGIAPLELVRTRMQADMTVARAGVLAALRAETSRGVLRLWRGLTPTLWRDVPFSAVYWLGYEQIKMRSRNALLAAQPDDAERLPFNQMFGVSFAAGFGAGTLAAVTTHPFDVVKTQMQVYADVAGGAPAAGGAAAKKSIPGGFSILRSIVRRQGLAGAYVGIAARVSKVAPACAIMISSYEVGKRVFADRMIDGCTVGQRE